MRCLRVSVQAGLTPDRLGPRPDGAQSGRPSIRGLKGLLTQTECGVSHRKRRTKCEFLNKLHQGKKCKLFRAKKNSKFLRHGADLLRTRR